MKKDKIKFSERFKQWKPFKKSMYITGVSLGVVIGLSIVAIGSYTGYVFGQYYRIDDNYNLEDDTIKQASLDAASITSSTELTFMTYNIGFGAYSQDFSFFLDSGYMNDGSKVQGEFAKAKSKEDVLKNTNGVISVIQDLDPTFSFFQEVDIDSDRSRHVDQINMLNDSNKDKDIVNVQYGDSAYLLYPLHDPIGHYKTHMTTMSKYSIDSSLRRSFPVMEGFSKLFDMDRCFVVSRLNLSNDKQLVIVNVHMSAYDEGGSVRKAQFDMLNSFLKEEYSLGNYLVLGGDFNHRLNEVEFESQQPLPGWAKLVSNEDISLGYSIVAGTNCPTVRSADMAYNEGVNFTGIIDGFIVSDNINVSYIKNVETSTDEKDGFAYSDHDPAVLRVTLDL